jgi:hypothetical protein
MPSPYQETIAAAFQDELMKIKSAEATGGKLSPTTLKTIGLIGAGAMGYKTVSQANDDRRMGRTMRLQQQNY